MKKIPEFGAGDPTQTRRSSVKGFNGARSYRETKDVIREKRVKFTDPELDCPPNIRPELSSGKHEEAGSPGTNAPKTSEYAFFKKLKKDAGCRRSYPLHKDDNQMKDFEPSGDNREITNLFKESCDNLRSSLFVERSIMNNHNMFFSPIANTSNNSGAESLDEVFSGKRKKLHQWVAETSPPEVEEPYPEGCEMVSMLLKRLFPDSDENKYLRDAKPTQRRADNKCLSPAFPESDTCNKELFWTRRKELMETESQWYLDDFCNRSSEIIPSKWYTKGSDSCSTRYDCEGGTASLITVQDPYFCSNFESCGSTALTGLKELNEFHNLGESTNRREPSTLLLGWDFENLKDGDLSITTFDEDMNSRYTLAALQDDHQQTLDNRFDAGDLYPSSFFSCYPPKLSSLPYPHSANLYNRELERLVEEEKFLFAELKDLPLSLSCAQKYLNIREDCKTLNSCEVRSAVSCQNHQWDVSKVFRENHHSDLKALLSSSGKDFDLGRKCLSISDFIGELHPSAWDGFRFPKKAHRSSYLLPEREQEDCLYSFNHRQIITQFAEDTLGSDVCPSINLQMPCDKEMARPLLLDSSNWLSSEEDMHGEDDDDDDEMTYNVCRKVFG